MRGRAGVIGAHHALELAQHPRGLVLVLGHHRQRADPLAIEREGLGEGTGHQEIHAGFCEEPHGRRIGVDPVTKALIGDVQERHEPALAAGVHHLLPLRIGQVDAGRVVAARVQHHDRGGRQRAKRRQHLLELHAVAGRVVVGIGVDGEAGRLEERAMILPAGVADPDLRIGDEAADEVGANLECTSAAQGLYGGDTLVGEKWRVAAEQQPLDSLVVLGEPVDGYVATGRRLLQPQGLGLAHGLKQRDLAGVVVVDPDPQIDLAGTGVGDECLGQPQDGVAGGHRDG